MNPPDPDNRPTPKTRVLAPFRSPSRGRTAYRDRQPPPCRGGSRGHGHGRRGSGGGQLRGPGLDKDDTVKNLECEEGLVHASGGLSRVFSAQFDRNIPGLGVPLGSAPPENTPTPTQTP